MPILITGSNGLIGSEAVTYYDQMGADVVGIDNNMRAIFFGPQGDTLWNLERLKKSTRNFKHHPIDIRDYDALNRLFEKYQFDRVIHCAAQPSHDKAKDIPLIDFAVNATGTLNLLEATRQHAPDAIFLHMSTNKVYGDAPNEVPLVELASRWDYKNDADFNGIDETCRIDRSTHSVFGASKTAADIMAQEYGRYFGLKVGVFRGGCLTGASHSGVKLHGFLSYLVKTIVGRQRYTIFGYKGKQVRDNIHSLDVIRLFEAFSADPKAGEVYNMGGGRENSISVLEAITLIEKISGIEADIAYSDQNRHGDHICYISDLGKIKRDFPDWHLTYDLQRIIEEMVDAELARIKTHKEVVN